MACGEDNKSPETPTNINLEFNLVRIESVSTPDKDGKRTIVLNFEDKSDNVLKMTAVSWHSHLEAGRYAIGSETGRSKVAGEFSMGGENIEIKNGTLLVSKRNYEYDIRIDLEIETGTALAVISGKKLYFETDEYNSLSTGANEFYQKDQKIQSKILGCEMNYSIYLPEGYDGTKKYPILYILHGMGGNNNDWLQDNTGGLWAGGGAMPAYAREYAEKTGKNLIIVSPEGRNLFYCNGFEPGMNYMSYFFEEFVPFIESTYSVKAERGSRAIGGLSMGGYGSLYYGLLHPEMFCYVYACSAAVNVGGAGPDPLQFLPEIKKAGKINELPGFTLEIGTEDTVVGSNEPFLDSLEGYGIPYEYITRPGAHDWKFWNACSPKIIHKVLSIFE